jgi:radical SAM protein with 4Fe4S-binding SPASM domain
MKEINLSTIVGCPVGCSYCPQKVLLTAYRRNVRLLTFENLKILLKNIDRGIIINFAGVGENFFNPEFVDMVIYTYNDGRRIGLYSTMQGIDKEKADRLVNSKIKFETVFFHRYTGKDFNKRLFNYGEARFTNEIEITHRYGDLPDITSRAGNLETPNPVFKTGRLKCNHFDKDLVFYENTMLPNGDLYMCCEDFGLKHKIGNLYEHDYESDVFNIERSKLQELQNMAVSDIICRRCEYAMQI